MALSKNTVSRNEGSTAGLQTYIIGFLRKRTRWPLPSQCNAFCSCRGWCANIFNRSRLWISKENIFAENLQGLPGEPLLTSSAALLQIKHVFKTKQVSLRETFLDLMWMEYNILHIAMKNNNSKSGSYGHTISHMTLLLHRSLHYCVTSPAHRCSDLTLSRNDNERWAPPPRALTPLPVPSGLQSPNFNTFWNRYIFLLLLLSSAQTIASGFWLHRGKEGIVNDFAPVVLARIYKTRLGLDYHCNEEK